MFVQAFRHKAVELKVPRTLVTPHLMGRTIGPAHDRGRQREVVTAALELLEDARSPGTIVDLDG